MPQLGNEKNPIVLNSSSKPKSTRVLGLLGSAYSGEAKQKYVDNYDRIFGNKTELEIARETSKTFSMEQD